MANIRTTAAEWATAKKMFEEGKLLRTISEKTGISIPSLSKRSNKEKWVRIGQDNTDAPIHKPDDGIGKQVKTMAAFGLVDDEIAAIVGIKVSVLQKTYQKELTTANPEMVARVAQSMFRMATDSNKPNVTAAIFWLKCRGGWSEEGAKSSLGKKDQRKVAAGRVAEGKFAPAAPPRLIVNNK